ICTHRWQMSSACLVFKKVLHQRYFHIGFGYLENHYLPQLESYQVYYQQLFPGRKTFRECNLPSRA
ncbi:hypothetical protein ACP6PL_12945, partial [Dapis sp. BLCC M126]|uniref:hypothetical protein n=1 Tax=Dapis sp. BLCC M126 TaxID=3400189 RepID=UPI003CEB6B83